MGENQKRILQMLAEGKITVDEATRLLSLVTSDEGKDSRQTPKAARGDAKYLYVRVEPRPGRESKENAASTCVSRSA